MSRRIENLEDRVRTAELNRLSALGDLAAETKGKKGECWHKCSSWLPSQGAMATIGRRMLPSGDVRTTIHIAEKGLSITSGSDKPHQFRIRTADSPTATYIARGGIFAMKARGGGDTISDRPAGIPASHRAVLESLPLILAETTVKRLDPHDAERRAGEIHNRFQPSIDRAVSAIRVEARTQIAQHEGVAMSALSRRTEARAALVKTKGVIGWAYIESGNRKLLSIDRKTGNLVVKLPASRVTELVASGQALPFAPGGRTFREWATFSVPDRAVWVVLLDEARSFAMTSGS